MNPVEREGFHNKVNQDAWTLIGDSVSIRKFVESDLSSKYVSWLNDPEIVRYSNQRFLTHNLDSSRSYLASFESSANCFLAIEENDTKRLIGTMTVYMQPNHGTADVGILLGEKSLWGRGYGGQAWCLVIDWLLHICTVRKVTAGTLACNRGMVSLMYQAGMCIEATRQDQELVNGKPEDVVYFAKFRRV